MDDKYKDINNNYNLQLLASMPNSISSDTKSNTTGTSGSTPPSSPLPFSLLGGLTGALFGGLGEIFSMNSVQDRLKGAVKSLDKLKYDSKEKEEELDKVGDAYNTQTMNQFNSSAFNLQGILNSNTLRALQSSQLLGQRATALLAKEQEMDKYNKELEMQKIQLKAGTDTSFNFGNVFSSILSGAMIGDKIK